MPIQIRLGGWEPVHFEESNRAGLRVPLVGDYGLYLQRAFKGVNEELDLGGFVVTKLGNVISNQWTALSQMPLSEAEPE